MVKLLALLHLSFVYAHLKGHHYFTDTTIIKIYNDISNIEPRSILKLLLKIKSYLFIVLVDIKGNVSSSHNIYEFNTFHSLFTRNT